MTRAQRRRHLLMWLILGPAILIGFALGLNARKAAPVEDYKPPAAEGAQP